MMWRILFLGSIVCLATLTNGQQTPEPPRITKFLTKDLLAPEDVKFRTDNAMRLPCAASGNNLEWTWKHNDTEISAAQIQHGNQFKVSADGTLTGSNLGSSQSGNYQCFVKDTVTNVETFSRKIQVAVTVVGTFLNPIDVEVRVDLGEELSYRCPSHNPSYGVSYSWVGKLSDADIQFKSNDRRAISPTGQLFIMYVTQQDFDEVNGFQNQGIRCTISGANSYQRSGLLKIIKKTPGKYDPGTTSAPSWRKIPGMVEKAVEGRNKTLYCLAVGRPAPTITWKKNGVTIVHRQNDRQNSYEIPSTFQGRLLNIVNVQRDKHQDTYSCEAENSESNGYPLVYHINLIVEAAPRWTTEAPEANQTIDVNANGSLTCDVFAHPAPSFEWYKNGKHIFVSTNNVRLNNNKLNFYKVRYPDETGVYQCVAENQHGMIVSSTWLQVLAPGPPSDVQVYAFAKYILVTWKAPLEPNGIITKYRVGSKEYPGSQPAVDPAVNAQEVSAAVNRKLLGNHTPEKNYVVEIEARTRKGWGQKFQKTTATVKYAAPAKPERPTVEGTTVDKVKVIYNIGFGAGYTDEFLVMYRKKSEGKQFKNTSWLNYFETQSTEIEGLSPDLYEFKTVGRNDYPNDSNESPASDVTEKRLLPGVFNRIITEEVTITEEDDVILNCTLEHFDGRHVWSREDGTPVLTTTRVLTEDTQLEIKQASIADTGVFVCKNGQFITHRFIVLVEVLVKVQMIVKVLNYEYTPELKNKSSEIYKATERNFTSEMDKVYNNTPGYVRTEVLNFTKGSVNVDFRVIITITASDPKNATTIPDTKAETAHRVVVEAKDGFVKQLKVDPNVEVFSPPLEPKDVEIFGIKSDELSVRWKPPADSDAFKVLKYYVQYKEFTAGVYINVSFPATQGKNTYSYRIQDLEAETTYLVRAGAGNKYGTNFNEAEGHKTDPAPFATWIIVLIVLAILLVLGIIVGLIVCKRRRSEQRRRALEEEEDNRFGGLIGDVRMNPVSHYEDKNVKGLKYSYTNESFRPSEVNWKEIPYEKLTLMNELGSGAFGVVYKGELKRENGDVTPCAVKSLKASATSEEIRDLYNELEIMTNVGYHPNLVNLLGACTQDGHLLVVLEIAENGSLLEFLKKSRETNQNYENINSGGLTEEMKLKIATDVAKGMSHLANCRCIHRDLAARNVLLGENYVAKVSDYGMARDVYEQLMYKKETQGKLPVKWMAIESLETYIFTVESDVWSYGVLLWEIESAGLKPYAGMNTTELITELKKGYRLEKPAGCSDAMYQIMRDCWSPNPKARPTFDELVARLENMAVTS